MITRLRHGLSHLNGHRFNHNFNNFINPLCTCSLDIESTVHFFLHCNYYNSARISFLNDLNSVDKTLLNLSDLSLVSVLLYGGPQFHDSQNALTLNSSIITIIFFFLFNFFPQFFYSLLLYLVSYKVQGYVIVLVVCFIIV